ncbi:hypothetical protein OM076_04820 [Solirubrobacter ginsenosidimutans]|uniref:Replication initiation protein n=1 Tax=Solirubrobacter ginsenosidimutans TaxID=490573 RepID=A0A9X3MTT1_9ACTN|nr:replication initiator [Solirubrobacter ginsenosidimutans]MDA0159578.1 hypothetical protein [Solirubrobacter ginsenosidimutans]
MTPGLAAGEGFTPELLVELAERAGQPDFPRLEKQLRSTGYCARPVRLKGHTEVCGEDGRWRSTWSTATEPDGVLRKACGNRREAICPACAERYRQDAYHLIAAGLRGGKGVPDSVSAHPMIFATLTAPSFGPVHTRVLGADGRPKRCRPRRDAPVCPHGESLSCTAVHDEGDECLGAALCRECFEYDRALLWNSLLGELWRRTTIYLPRKLAQRLGITQKRLKQLVRAAYVKVAEYQQRGLVHVHVVIRLDEALPTYRRDVIRAPDHRFTVELLEHALRAAAAAVTVPVPAEAGGGFVRWGAQLDVQHIGANEAGRCAGYLAKYATKATEQAGGVLHRVSEHEVDELAVSPHVREYLRHAFALDVQVADRKLARNAHAFGYRGHCLTKSRRYSTTFKQLRADREAFVHAQILARSRDAAQLAIAAAAPDRRRGVYAFDGQGHFTTLQGLLAEKGRAREREMRRIAREELCDQPPTRREHPCQTPQR